MIQQRNASFEQVSADVGQIDESALETLAKHDLDAAAALLADMSVAVDHRLRNLARQLAARLFVRMAAEPGSGRASRRLTFSTPDAGGDLDVERTLDRAGGRKPTSTDELVTRAWGSSRAKVVLLIDRSGSMSGMAVARAATAAAAITIAAAGRAHCGVVAFARDRIVLQPVGGDSRPADLVDQLLSLRGHGTTDIAGALREAVASLASGPAAAEQIVVLFSDCIATEGADPVKSLRGIDRLHVITPNDEAETMSAARRLAAPSGGRVKVAASLAEVVRVVPGLLG